MKENFPSKCVECGCYKTCQSFYGWHGCHYNKEINEKRLNNERGVNK